MRSCPRREGLDEIALGAEGIGTFVGAESAEHESAGQDCEEIGVQPVLERQQRAAR